ncbi:hypothetical protein [Streptomyces sp. GESEQ-13]|uniref:hypothetical protein n=1 Tax=Streptomyces sp. GESEQ-13 TaxID=2812654 RepID=UPI001B31EB6F
MTHQPETARALLHRHGLPEDIIDGALCLHAQELAAVQRAALAKTDDPVFYEGEAGWLVNLIDPTRTPAAVPAAVAPPTNQTALRDRIRLAIARQWLDEMGSDRTVDELDDAEFGEFADAVLPSAADWDALVREADRLRRDGKTLHARAEELDTQLAALRQQITEPADRAAVLREAADHAYRIARRLDEQEHDERAQGAWDVENTLRAELRRMADETATEHRCVCSHPADEHSVYGCADDCACEWVPKRKPAAGARQDGDQS